MRSVRDEMVRYREECKRLQAQIAELNRTRTVIEGVPEKEHANALDAIARLEGRIQHQAGAIAALKSEKDDTHRPVAEAQEKAARSTAEAQALARDVDRLQSQLQSARTSLVKLADQKNAQIRELQGRVNELEGTLRAYNDNPN